jgi:hypothetical protein
MTHDLLEIKIRTKTFRYEVPGYFWMLWLKVSQFEDQPLA